MVKAITGLNMASVAVKHIKAQCRKQSESNFFTMPMSFELYRLPEVYPDECVTASLMHFNS